MEQKVKKGSTRRAYILGIAGIVLTILIAVAVVYFWEDVQRLEHYGYLGAFIISVIGGATILGTGEVALILDIPTLIS